MNPGSSQFASQFPDAEETMSKMESKKLQLYGNAITAAAARIAHEPMDPARKTPETPLEREQREVIKQLVQALQLCQPSHPYETVGTCLRGQALAAAAPYIQED